MSEIVSINGYDIKDLKAIRSYTNVANMKSDLKLKEGMHVKTKGYYNSNDGGSAEYYIRTKTNEDIENNGTIHIIGNLVAELITNEVLNVKQFGAKGDGVTDDTTAFVNMFNVDSYNYYIPKGNYLVDHNICTLEDIEHNIKVYGDGTSLTRLKLKDNCITEGTQPMFSLKNNPNNTSAIDIEFRDLYIDMNRTNNHSIIDQEEDEWALQWCHGIDLNTQSLNGINAKVQDLEFYDCIADGVCFSGGTNRTFDSIMATNIVAKGREGTRDDVCITADFNNAIISNCDLDAFEVEVNVYELSCDHNMVVENCITRKRFDVDGHYSIATNDKPATYIINNCICNGIILFSGVYAKVSNSVLNLGNSIMRPRNGAYVEFINCDINDNYKTEDTNAMISIIEGYITKLLFKNCNISVKNSRWFLYCDTPNSDPSKYDITFDNNYITGLPSATFCRISATNINLYNNVIEFTGNKPVLYLGNLYNSYDINIKNNIMKGQGTMLNCTANVVESTPQEAVITIRSKNNTDNALGHLITWDFENLTPTRGGTGTLYDVLEVDDYEYDKQPNTGRWIKGQRVYNRKADGTTLGWVCTVSGTYQTATFSTF